MSAQAAMEIINDIASQLGVAAGYIIPEIARMEIAQTTLGGGCSIAYLDNFSPVFKNTAIKGITQ